jgi:DNA-binding SARP family transcriptional activator
VTVAAPVLRLALLKSFDLRHDRAAVPLPLSAQRVLAFLALHDRPVQRLFVAGNLWLEVSEEKANASLRTALWRLRRPDCALVTATSTQLALAPGVEVDVRDRTALATDVLRRGEAPSVDELYELAAAGELLPDWYDDWVLIERERFRQLRLYALETLCERFTAVGRIAEATQAGLAAVACEPLRESSHRALVKAHLAEGNAGEALRQYRLYRELVRTHLGLEPSPQMDELVAAFTPR